jgi:hypothetical protein
MMPAVKINQKRKSSIRMRIRTQGQKERQKVKTALFRSAGCSVLGAEGFSCSFDTSYAGLGLSIL